MAETLPDPAWQSTPGVCLRCAYDLKDLAAPGVCPECAWAFDASCLLVYGIPETGGGPLWRRFAWAALGLVTVILMTIWPVLFLMWWPAPLLVLAACGGGIFYLLSTSKRERRGTERLLFSPSGLARAALKLTEDGRAEEGIVVPWGAGAAVSIERIGPFWAKLSLVTHTDDGRQSTFRAGIRCPQAMIPTVLSTINAYARGESPSPAAPPTAPPTEPQ